MERDTIERLAMDRALGELDPDTMVLFEAYLAEHPEARRWAGPMGQICDQTRDAIAQKTHRDVRVAQSGCVPSLPIYRYAIVRWAAVIAVSALLGVTVDRWTRVPPVQAPETVVVRAPAPDAGPQGWRKVLSEPEQSFWQSKAVAMLQSQPTEMPTPPESRPGLWDRYRQFRKERSHEEIY